MNKIFLTILSSLFLLILVPAQAQESLRPAPDFTLTDINGKKVSLSDFKGKIVYLDIWASWCGPCVAEIPASKKLQRKFEGNSSIVFINISLDQDTAQWKQKVNGKQMAGMQLLSPKGRESDIKNNYEVNTIPRFIIINKEGQIADYDALRPSERGLYEQLTALINQ